LADPGYWLLDAGFLDLIISAAVDIQHQVSSIEHLPGNGSRLKRTGYVI